MSQKIFIVLLAVVLALLCINVAASVFFYKQYKDNISYFDQQNWLTRVKLENVEKSVDTYKNTMESLNSQVNNYAETLSTLDKKVAMTDSDRKDALATVDILQTAVQGLQKKYTESFNDLRERTEILKTNMEQLAKGMTNQVDLGKIAVRSEPVAAAAEGASDSSTAGGSNFSTKK